MSELLCDLLLNTASRAPGLEALKAGSASFSYADFGASVQGFATGLVELGLSRQERVAVWLEPRHETALTLFGASRAGCVFVPVNPTLKAEQVAYILADCNVRLLVTSADRWKLLAGSIAMCPDLAHVALIGESKNGAECEPDSVASRVALHAFSDIAATRPGRVHRVIDADMTAILYTSGSTGRPKGVVLSHRNMVAGARSVASYLDNGPQDRILAVLPLSFDYGLSQLTTAFSVGACAVLHNFLLPGDVIRALVRERITGLAAVPPLWIQLAALKWPEGIDEHLRYFTNSGGAMPTATLAALRRHVPRARPFLMYGLTEAFRSTFLPPEEVDRRPTSMGKAIPNAEILVVREDGSECDANEPGELVHRGALVSLGYWNDPDKTAERFKPLPGQRKELVMTEHAVWSGDTVKRDEDGFLYFVSRRDEMIKTSGYRVSPTEIEEVLYRTGLVAEAAAFGVEHPVLGHAIVVVAQTAQGHAPDTAKLIDACRDALPLYMLPKQVDWLDQPLPRNANGKIDRKTLAGERRALFTDSPGH